MTSIMKKGKFYHWKWKQEGNIDNRESANYKNMREQKKKLRSAQRRLAAAKRDNTYTRIMNLNERNDKQFFALVNRQRCVRSVNTPILKIDAKTFNNPVTVLDAWADYFEDLTYMVIIGFCLRNGTKISPLKLNGKGRFHVDLKKSKE